MKRNEIDRKIDLLVLDMKKERTSPDNAILSLERLLNNEVTELNTGKRPLKKKICNLKRKIKNGYI